MLELTLPLLAPSPAALPAWAAREPTHRLWDQLSEYAASDTEAALQRLLGSVAAMIDAQNAYWVGSVRIGEAGDPLLGWRPRRICTLRPLPCEGETLGDDRVRPMPASAIDEYAVALARQAGTFRANRYRDLVSPAWFEGDTYRRQSRLGVGDILTVVAPISADAESYYGFLRLRRGESFSDAERDRAAYALRGLTWFHRRVLLAYGLLVANTPLSPAERRVMGLLLTDRSEKLIADELRLSAATLHTYVRRILRKFGVSGRAGLEAVWLGQG